MYDPDQSGSGLFDILRGGTERFLTNIKDTSSKVIQSVARYSALRKTDHDCKCDSSSFNYFGFILFP